MPAKRKYTKYTKKKKRTNTVPSKLSIYNPWYLSKSRRVDHQITVVRPYEFQGQINFTPGFDSSIGVSFRLDQLHDIASFRRMFDYYRIDAVYVKFIPFTTEKNINNIGLNHRIPNYTICIDRDDVNVLPSDFNTLKSRKGSRTQSCLTARTVSFTPTRLLGVLDGNGVLQPCVVDSDTNMMIDTEKIDIIHYGLKVAIDGSESTAAAPTGFFNVQLSVSMKVTFMNTKI